MKQRTKGIMSRAVSMAAGLSLFAGTISFTPATAMASINNGYSNYAFAVEVLAEDDDASNTEGADINNTEKPGALGVLATNGHTATATVGNINNTSDEGYKYTGYIKANGENSKAAVTTGTIEGGVGTELSISDGGTVELNTKGITSSSSCALGVNNQGGNATISVDGDVISTVKEAAGGVINVNSSGEKAVTAVTVSGKAKSPDYGFQAEIYENSTATAELKGAVEGGVYARAHSGSNVAVNANSGISADQLSGITVEASEKSNVKINVKGDVKTSTTRDFVTVNAKTTENSAISVSIDGNVEGKNAGIYAVADTGLVMVSVKGDVKSSNSYGLRTANRDGGRVDILVTGSVTGDNGGLYTGELDLEKLNVTVWSISTDNEEVDKSINYIIKHADNVNPVKADGSALAKSHDYEVAKEGERVYVKPTEAGKQVTKAYNNGVEITTKDDNGFYIDVPKGGGVYLTIDNAETAPEKQDEPKKEEEKKQENPAAEADIRAFVERLYTKMLNRAGDPAGIEDWTNKLVKKEQTGAQVAQGFILSKELKDQDLSDEEFIQRLYRTFFNSEGDEAGKAYWLDMLKKGHSRKFVFRGFAESDQYSGLCAEYGIERGKVELSEKDQECSDDNLHIDKEKVGQYVDRLFQTILGRDGDPAGRQYWIDRIVNREEKAASVAMRGFFTSEEYKNLNKSDEEFINDVYRAILGRDADAAGIAYWKEKLESGEYTRARLIEVGFGASDEFADILRSYGLKMAKQD